MERSNLKSFFSRLKLLPLLLVPMVALATTKSDVGIFSSSVKIGGTTPAASTVALDISSTTKGFLGPRMTNTQRDAIAAPTVGLMVFSSTDNSYEYWDGASWSLIGGGVAPLTASRAVVTNGSGVLSAATTTATEIGYVNGVTSAIQTQLNLKAPAASPTFTGTTTFSGLTATTVPYLDGSKVLTSSAVTPTELGYVSGVSSAIQTQFTGKASTTLNNLGTTAINAALLASAANSWDIGSAAAYFKNGYGLTWQTNTDSGAFILNPTDTATTGRFKYESSAYTLSSRQSDTGAGRPLTILTDDVAGANANATGSISITTGSKTAGTGDSGPITLTTGTSTGGTRGRIKFLDGTEGYAGMVWTTTNNAGSGQWQYPTGANNGIAGNPGAEYTSSSNTPGWATYADAAATTPVDGTGGAPSVTWTRTTSSPLSGVGSFLFTKDTTNRQGNGASYDFSVTTADKAKVMQIEFDYAVVSGTFVPGSSSVDSDIEVYIYDVSNSTLIQPSTYKLYSNSTSPASHFVSNFQTASNSTSYRLILHTATTSAGAGTDYVVKFDNFAVSASKYTYGTPVTDWTAFTPTGSWSTNTTYTGFWRRVGGDMEVQTKLTLAGAPTSATLTVNLPTGYTIDTARLAAVGSGRANLGSSSIFDDSAVAAYNAQVDYSSTTAVTLVYQSNASGIQSGVTQALPITFANLDTVQMNYKVPIVGWSSTVQMSDTTDQRVVAASVSRITSTFAVGTAATKVQWNSTVSDTHGAWDAVNFRYVIPTAGKYSFTGSMDLVAAASFTAYVTLLYKNGSPLKSQVGIGSATVNVGGAFSFDDVAVAGDYYEIYVSTSGAASGVLSSSTITGGSTWDIKRIQGPTAIGATETVSAKYVNTAGTSITNTGADINVPFATKVWDTHSFFNGTVATLPVSGKYRVSCTVNLASLLWAANNQVNVTIYQNGAVASIGPLGTIWAALTTTTGNFATTELQGSSGDTVECRLAHSRSGGAATLNTTAGTNHFEITRIGM